MRGPVLAGVEGSVEWETWRGEGGGGGGGGGGRTFCTVLFHFTPPTRTLTVLLARPADRTTPWSSLNPLPAWAAALGADMVYSDDSKRGVLEGVRGRAGVEFGISSGQSRGKTMGRHLGRLWHPRVALTWLDSRGKRAWMWSSAGGVRDAPSSSTARPKIWRLQSCRGLARSVGHCAPLTFRPRCQAPSRTPVDGGTETHASVSSKEGDQITKNTENRPTRKILLELLWVCLQYLPSSIP